MNVVVEPDDSLTKPVAPVNVIIVAVNVEIANVDILLPLFVNPVIFGVCPTTNPSVIQDPEVLVYVLPVAFTLTFANLHVNNVQFTVAPDISVTKPVAPVNVIIVAVNVEIANVDILLPLFVNPDHVIICPTAKPSLIKEPLVLVYVLLVEFTLTLVNEPVVLPLNVDIVDQLVPDQLFITPTPLSESG